MNLVKRNHNVFPSIFDEFLKADWAGGLESKMNVPAVNILEKEDSFEILLSAPGRKKEDFNLEIDQKVLKISSEINEEQTTEGKYTRKEFSHVTFSRTFTLPDSVNEDQINANYENGILKIALPKKKEALPKAKRLIEII